VGVLLPLSPRKQVTHTHIIFEPNSSSLLYTNSVKRVSSIQGAQTVLCNKDCVVCASAAWFCRLRVKLKMHVAGTVDSYRPRKGLLTVFPECTASSVQYPNPTTVVRPC